MDRLVLCWRQEVKRKYFVMDRTLWVARYLNWCVGVCDLFYDRMRHRSVRLSEGRTVPPNVAKRCSVGLDFGPRS